ncbi:Ion channel [Ancylostoma ceylanicum]|uniref:Ion channel n=1 Tax=Ancylostoma ceylanicum TaxID=53326 RepID=A0A0D6LJA3_9BILA|nr:Ion channel [Ancylostoma ceylanicum]
MVRIRKAALDTTIRSIAEEMTQTVNDPNKTVDVETMVEYLQLTYITLLKQESAYKDSTFYKAEDGKNLKWTFGSSFFFSMNVFTTTGYGKTTVWLSVKSATPYPNFYTGSIAPESTLGKTCVIIYGFIFVPLTLVVIRHLGNWTLLIVTNIYAKCVIRWR